MPHSPHNFVGFDHLATAANIFRNAGFATGIGATVHVETLTAFPWLFAQGFKMPLQAYNIMPGKMFLYLMIRVAAPRRSLGAIADHTRKPYFMR